jgi:hypothetical protein
MEIRVVGAGFHIAIIAQRQFVPIFNYNPCPQTCVSKRIIFRSPPNFKTIPTNFKGDSPPARLRHIPNNDYLLIET